MIDFEFLGPYRVAERIGQGGMGTVYRGTHVKTGQRVAIKVLARQMSQESRFRRRFDAEIETLKKLNHPNIVRLIGYGEEQGLLFYSMELVEGPSLLEHLRQVKRLDWDTVLGIGIDICAALKHAHDFGVIHRDLKPANLLMEPEGRLKLTDFGIAKLFGANEQTAAGSVLGTADYMAPEQAAGGVVTPRTDLYALGSLLYACLVGRPPFGGRNLTQVIHGLKHETPVPLDLVLPEVPLELAELVHELLAKSPEDRPPTALAVGKRLASMRVGLHRRGELTQLDLSRPTTSDPIVPSGETTHTEAFPSPSADAPPLGTSRPETSRPKFSRPETSRPDAGGSRSEGSPSAEPNPSISGSDFPTISERDSDVPTGSGAAGTLAAPRGSAAQHGPSAGRGGATQRSRDTTQDDVAEAVAQPQTRFESVPTPGRRGAWGDAPEGSRDSWQWISIGGLFLLLLLTVGVSLWMLRKPTRDDLLAEIAAAESADDPLAAKRAREDFLRLYPHDPAAETFREAQNTTEIEQLARQLRSRALRFGGVAMLDPVQQSWLEAIEGREQFPHATAEKLQTWLDVFGHAEAAQGSGPGDDSLRRLTEASRREVERLKASSEAWTDPRTTQLAAWLEWGRENLQGAERERFLKGLATLYQNKPWAAPVLEQIEG